MNDKGEIKISDFGVAKYIENTLGNANTFINIGAYMYKINLLLGARKD